MDSIPTSYSGITIENALSMTEILCNLSFKFSIENNLENLHKALKQLMSLYFDCKTGRFLISESLLKLKFAGFTVKTMKRLNNSGVFKNDDIWFSTFYFYNICWNYSDINSKFVLALVASGIDVLLITNIMHYPYTSNLAKKNVHYLIKTTLCVIHNILRVPGNRTRFSTEKVINALLNLSKGDDIMSVLSNICLGYIGCNENVLTSTEFDIYLNFKLLLYYVKEASNTDEKHMGFTMLEFLEVIRASSLCKIQRNAIISLGGLDLLLNLLNQTKEYQNKVEVLYILANIINNDNTDSIQKIAEMYSSSDLIANNSNESMSQCSKLVTAAKHLLWKLSLADISCKKEIIGTKVFVNFADNDEEKARVIFDKLGDCKIVPFASHENDCELLKSCYDEACIVIVCVSESFKNSVYFATGTDYCLRQKKVVFPVIVDKSYQKEGWLRTFITASSDVSYNLSTDEMMEETWPKFKSDLMVQLTNVVMTELTAKEDCAKMSTDCVVVTTTVNNDVNIVSQWLQGHQLTHLQSKMADINMDMLLILREMRKNAPEYYFNSLEKHLHLSFTEILQFNNALSSLMQSQ